MNTRQPLVVIDGNELSFEPGETVLQVAARAEIEIPTLCNDERLQPAGACRMCLVEVEGSRLMRPACATPAEAGMVVRTDTARVDRNRRFLLSLHQTDVGGPSQTLPVVEELVPSRLEDLCHDYGTAGTWPKVDSPRQGRPHDSNPFIHFRAENCIACSLCVRYCDEIEAVSAITMAGRGSTTTVATADLLALNETTCEMCGGCISVCPTGAMVDTGALDYARQTGRVEKDLEQVRTTCNFCGVGCQLDLHVDRAANHLVKVTAPPPGTTVNDGNLCVKGRFANDFVRHPDRLTTPLVRNDRGELVEASWDEALDRAVEGLRAVADKDGADALAFISSSRCTVEENYLVQKMSRAVFGTHNVHQCAAT
jgi:predicted molibdopterin-dependent oxidoreductase YjgC